MSQEDSRKLISFSVEVEELNKYEKYNSLHLRWLALILPCFIFCNFLAKFLLNIRNQIINNLNY